MPLAGLRFRLSPNSTFIHLRAFFLISIALCREPYSSSWKSRGGVRELSEPSIRPSSHSAFSGGGQRSWSWAIGRWCSRPGWTRPSRRQGGGRCLLVCFFRVCAHLCIQSHRRGIWEGRQCCIGRDDSSCGFGWQQATLCCQLWYAAFPYSTNLMPGVLNFLIPCITPRQWQDSSECSRVLPIVAW